MFIGFSSKTECGELRVYNCNNLGVGRRKGGKRDVAYISDVSESLGAR